MAREPKLETMDSDALCREVAAAHDGVCFLAFSRGKDSICCWLQLQKYFRRIIPIFRYMVPGLEFEDRSLEYFEKFFGQRIIRLPKPRMIDWMRTAAMQTPDRRLVLDQYDWPVVDEDDQREILCEELDLPLDTPIAVGVRQGDSIRRRLAIRKTGAWKKAEHVFYPVYDWSIPQERAAIAEAGIELPIDYQLFGRSFDGLTYQYLEPMRRELPADYARVLEWFPLAEAEMFRWDKARERRHGKT